MQPTERHPRICKLGPLFIGGFIIIPSSWPDFNTSRSFGQAVTSWQNRCVSSCHRTTLGNLCQQIPFLKISFAKSVRTSAQRYKWQNYHKHITQHSRHCRIHQFLPLERPQRSAEAHMYALPRISLFSKFLLSQLALAGTQLEITDPVCTAGPRTPTILHLHYSTLAFLFPHNPVFCRQSCQYLSHSRLLTPIALLTSHSSRTTTCSTAYHRPPLLLPHRVLSVSRNMSI